MSPDTTRPNVYMERNSSGQLFIGAVYFEHGNAVRAAVLAFQPDFVSDATFTRQFEDIKQLARGADD